jgi:hypothetical protein
MSTVLFSKTFIEKINKIIRRLWWAGVQEEHLSNPIAYRSREDISKPTNQGGLGIRDMVLVNKCLIISSAWNVITNKNPFLTTVLRLNIILIILFGQHLYQLQNQFSGLLF